MQLCALPRLTAAHFTCRGRTLPSPDRACCRSDRPRGRARAAGGGAQQPQHHLFRAPSWGGSGDGRGERRAALLRRGRAGSARQRHDPLHRTGDHARNRRRGTGVATLPSLTTCMFVVSVPLCCHGTPIAQLADGQLCKGDGLCRHLPTDVLSFCRCSLTRRTQQLQRETAWQWLTEQRRH